MTFSSDENSKRRHKPGKFESNKFEFRRSSYINYLKTVKTMGYSFEDLLHYFPCFVGEMTLSRVLALYEGYKIVNGVCGHIADVGVYKGASLLYFAKLTQIFEPTTLTQVHGFDWFQGNKPQGDIDKDILVGSSTEPYDRVNNLVKAQSLDHVAKLHQVDLTKDLENFFSVHSHLQFKLAFLDTGTYEVVKTALPYFWDRLTTGGIMVLDQFNFEIAPGETKAVVDFFKDKSRPILTFPNGWMPNAYIVK